MAGKGDTQRPASVPKKTFDENWDRIFKKKKEPIEEQWWDDKHSLMDTID
jgi:hypothetical protein